MNPTHTHPLPQPTQPRQHPPAGITPSPATITQRPPTPPPPAAQHTPHTTAELLCNLLRAERPDHHSQPSLTHLYTFSYSTVAVISLPHLTIWIQPRTLHWTHNGQHTTWPAHDTHGAARHLTRLTSPPPDTHPPTGRTAPPTPPTVQPRGPFQPPAPWAEGSHGAGPPPHNQPRSPAYPPPGHAAPA